MYLSPTTALYLKAYFAIRPQSFYPSVHGSIDPNSQNPKFWVTDFSLLSLTNSKLKVLSLLFETGKQSGVRHVLLFHTFFFHVLCSYEYLSSIDCINIQAPNSPLNLPVAESAGQIGFWCFFCNIVCTSNSLLHIIATCITFMFCDLISHSA